MESPLSNDQIPSCLRFSFDEIKRATNDFNHCLAEGWLGKVYFGNISGDSYSGKVAVKCLNLERFMGETLESQKEILTARRHANIISLVGFCDEQDQKILVYEFMPNLSLYDYLYKNQDKIPRLTVEQRLEICLGVAKGLTYLHSGTDFHIIHRDLRTGHILLDGSLVPKISGFAFSKVRAAGPSSSQIVTNHAYGLQGYMAPECYEPNHKVSRQADVYAFGVVLLEVLCERPPWQRLLVLALPFVMRGELPKFTPEYVERYISPECARVCEKLITDCLEFEQEKRPYMNQVVSELELALKLQKEYQDSKDHNINFQTNNEQSSGVNSRSRSFSIVEIKEATNDFSNLLGEGGFAKVYYGQIPGKSNNVDVAVKRMSINFEQGIPAFEIERKSLLACDHVNIISLVGYCDEEDEKILIYEFMPNGSLYDHIYKHHDPTPRMTIEQRLDICIGVAKGLNYLHSRNDYNIIHSDIKTDNILLDANFVPKISDFGLSRTREVGPAASAQITHKVHGTPGYIAPECYETNYKLSRKADVYAFGVVLLEVLCEKQAWENLIIWAQPFLFKGELPSFVPNHVRNNISPECSRACMNLIRDCLDNDPNNRPSMSHVIANLDFALTLQKMNLGQKRPSQAISQQIFSISDVKTITNEFAQRNIVTHSRRLGEVYRGNMSVDVAVKRINVMSEEAVRFFRKEIDLLSASHHANVISLLGYCDEPDEKILIYEFMPNGTLFDYLFKKQDQNVHLKVEQRLEICLGVAKGLSYLHSCTPFAIIHHDLTPNNILLDHNLVAKISHFELATKCVVGLSNLQEVPYTVRGTQGLIAPECYEPVNQKTDVYAFGATFLEVLSEKKFRWHGLIASALPIIMRGELQRLMPEHVKSYISPECARVCEDLLSNCLEDDPDKRPYMNQVVEKLESALNVQMQRANNY